MKKIFPNLRLIATDFTRNGGIKGLQRYGKQASGSTVTFHYYTQDYLGNNRAVINGSTGATEQTIAYYPFGAVIADLLSPMHGSTD